MGNKGRSETDIFGTVHHYDQFGKSTGRSEPGLFGGYTHYDSHGHKIGRSDEGLFGGYTHYDSHGHRTGRSDQGLFGSYNHYDSHGRSTGHSDQGFFGNYSHSSSSDGCYIATCVYGSYDCPQVWTLRRFRDNTLAKSHSGRAFIRAYYATSPTLVKLFGQTKWFKGMWRSVLDGMVSRLKSAGVQDTPYEDIKWH